MAGKSWIGFSIGSTMDYRRDPENFPVELKLGHTMKLVEKHNRVEEQKHAKELKRVEEPKRVEPVIMEEPIKLPPTAPLRRQKVLYRGGKRYEAKIHRIRMHSYPVQGYDV